MTGMSVVEYSTKQVTENVCRPGTGGWGGTVWVCVSNSKARQGRDETKTKPTIRSGAVTEISRIG